MTQLHKRMTTKQVKKVLHQYEMGLLDREIAMARLRVKKSRFYTLLNEFKSDPDNFSIEYQRETPSGFTRREERRIKLELLREKEIVENRKDNDIEKYNYSTVKRRLDNLRKVNISVPTIIERAKSCGCYLNEDLQRELHDQKVEKDYAGELVQHDASEHKFAPYIDQRLFLIASIDTFSRVIVACGIYLRETSYKHIQLLKQMVLNYGIPQVIYVDNDSVFRFVQHEHNNYPGRTHHKTTDDVDPRWKEIVKNLGAEVTYAYSPQAKGKVETIFSWLQERIVRRCARRKVKRVAKVQEILQEVVREYNTKIIHSNLEVTPQEKMNQAQKNNKTVFKDLMLEHEDKTLSDIFSLQAERRVNSYRKISLCNNEIKLSGVKPKTKVRINITKSEQCSDKAKLRFWHRGNFIQEETIAADELNKFNF